MRDHLANFTYKTDPIYRQTYDTKRNLTGNKIADHSGSSNLHPKLWDL